MLPGRTSFATVGSHPHVPALQGDDPRERGRLPAVPASPAFRRGRRARAGDGRGILGAAGRGHARSTRARRRLGVLRGAHDPQRAWRGALAAGRRRRRAAPDGVAHVHAVRRRGDARRAAAMIGGLVVAICRRTAVSHALCADRGAVPFRPARPGPDAVRRRDPARARHLAARDAAEEAAGSAGRPVSGAERRRCGAPEPRGPGARSGGMYLIRCLGVWFASLRSTCRGALAVPRREVDRMCLAVPMRIKSVDGFNAVCEAKGIERESQPVHAAGRGRSRPATTCSCTWATRSRR